MDALIRSVEFAPHRTRLSDMPADTAPAHSPGPVRSKLDALREEVGQQLRSEWAAERQALCDSERDQARAEGLASAVAQAQAAAAAELAQRSEKLAADARSAWAAMQQAHEAALAKLQASVGEVTFAAVCRVVGRKALSREFVLGMVEHTCALLRAELLATVRLHPRDVQALQELLQDGELRVRSLGLKVVADESLALGGCVIEAASGQYDGGLESQLRRLHAVLTDPVVNDDPGDAATAAGAHAL